MRTIQIDEGCVKVPLVEGDGVVINFTMTDGAWLKMPLDFAHQLFNDMGERLAKRAPDVEATYTRAYQLAQARIEVLAAELLAAQEAHGAERRKLEAAQKHGNECSAALAEQVKVNADLVARNRMVVAALARSERERATLKTAGGALGEQARTTERFVPVGAPDCATCEEVLNEIGAVWRRWAGE